MSGIKVTPGVIPGVKLIEPPVFGDDRGSFMESYHAVKYAALGVEKPFLQDNISRSARNVLRGLHYQCAHMQGKLVGAVDGEIFDVAVDIRKGSPAFGKWEGHILSGENRRQLYVPEGCVHGFIVLSDRATVLYKCTDVYFPAGDRGVRWDDPDIGIEWPGGTPLLSPKDAALPFLADLPEHEFPVFEGESA